MARRHFDDITKPEATELLLVLHSRDAFACQSWGSQARMILLVAHGPICIRDVVSSEEVQPSLRLARMDSCTFRHFQHSNSMF